VGEVLGRQILRSGTSVGANYRAALRARSRADFTARLAVAQEEADETLYWLEVFAEADLVPPTSLAGLIADADEILAMTVASIKTMKVRGAGPKPGTLVVQSKIQNPKSKISR
jgi:four helix bundle protein